MDVLNLIPISTSRLSEKWSTGLYVHGNLRNQKFDRNDDSFLDVPLKKQINVMNRWQYTQWGKRSC